MQVALQRAAEALADAAEALDRAAANGATAAWGREAGWAKLARASAQMARRNGGIALDASGMTMREIQI